MAHEGKRIRAAREGIDALKLYSIDDAIKLVKEKASAKFDETVEIGRASCRERVYACV